MSGRGVGRFLIINSQKDDVRKRRGGKFIKRNRYTMKSLNGWKGNLLERKKTFYQMKV